MKKESKFYKCLVLFITFMKIGLFTFGGGYAMIPLISKEVSEKHKWIREAELFDIIAISESTPGPIAVNCATYIGYRVAGFFGSLFATIGLAIPSFVIILIISFFYKDFIKWPVINAAFKGIKVGVIILILLALTKLWKNYKFTYWGIMLFAITLATTLLIAIFNVNFGYASLILIVLGIITGLIVEAIANKKGVRK